MKNEELDRLFKQKSELFRAEPSPQAWHRLETQLQHRRRGSFWFYISGIAASLLLFAGLWFAININNHTKDPQLVSAEKERKTLEVQGINSEALPPQEEIALNEPKTTAQPKAPKREEKPENQKPESSGNSKKRDAIALHQKSKPAQVNTGEEISDIETLPQLKGRAPEAVVVASVKPEIKEAGAPGLPERIIIRYTAQDEAGTNSSGVTEDLLTASKEEKELSVKSVIGFFKNVKENTSGSLADIRAAKDNLLSLRLGQQN